MSDIRSLLKQARQTRRITHPYAKYSSIGSLYCTACTQKISSEVLWESHISSSSHKQKVKDVIRASQQKAKRGIAATLMEEELLEEEQESNKRVRIEEPQPEPESEPEKGETKSVVTGEETLPEGFFDPGQKPRKVGVDEDEWKQFQVDIAETIRNQEEIDKQDEEELKRYIIDEFDEMSTLEDRLDRLKKRRADLQSAMKDVKPFAAPQEIAGEDEDEQDVEEEWW